MTRRSRSAAFAPSPPSLILVLLPLLAVPAGAQMAVGPHAGTLGLGAELSFGWSKAVVGRIVAAGWDQSLDVTAGGIDYDGDLELRNLAALVDLHPGGGSFHVTVGAVLNDDRLVATAPLSALLEDELGGIELPVGLDLGTLRGTARGKRLAPYAGLGWGNPLASSWSLRFDVGVFYLGPPQVDLAAETTLPIDQIPGGQALLDRLLAEQKAALEDEVKDARFYPVLTFAVSWRF